MSQAEITSLATLISTIIAAILIIYRQLKTDSNVNSNATTTNAKLDDASLKVGEVKTLVNGNLDKLVNTVTDIHSVLTNDDTHSAGTKP